MMEDKFFGLEYSVAAFSTKSISKVSRYLILSSTQSSRILTGI
jgi:hypothetical protein